MQGKKEEDIMQLAVYPRVREMLESNKDIVKILDNSKCYELKQEVINVNNPKQTMKV